MLSATLFLVLSSACGLVVQENEELEEATSALSSMADIKGKLESFTSNGADFSATYATASRRVRVTGKFNVATQQASVTFVDESTRETVTSTMKSFTEGSLQARSYTYDGKTGINNNNNNNNRLNTLTSLARSEFGAILGVLPLELGCIVPVEAHRALAAAVFPLQIFFKHVIAFNELVLRPEFVDHEALALRIGF
jgi:hypothetical protein